MVRYHDQYRSRRTILWKSQLVNLKDGIDFVMSFAIRESRRTSDDSPFVEVVGLFCLFANNELKRTHSAS